MTTQRLRREWCFVLGIILGVAMAVLGMRAVSNTRYHSDVEEYKACILEQHETRGYIVRSECSSMWRELDLLADLKYVQVGRDIYLSVEN